MNHSNDPHKLSENNHDFLRDLYAQTQKHEAPPVDLDQKILALAREQAPSNNKTALRQWQQALSVAAVMVLSVYIFFDVGEQSMNTERFMPQLDDSQLEATPFNQNSLPTKQKPIQALKNTKEKKVLSETSENTSEDLLDSRQKASSELIKKQAVQSKRHQREASSKMINHFAAPSAKQEVVESVADTFSLESKDDALSEFDPEVLLQEIKQLIADDKLLEAKRLYQQLSAMHPNYPVPRELIKVLQGK